MARPYNVIDADGHVLEPMDLWEKYIDPAFRARVPKLVIDHHVASDDPAGTKTVTDTQAVVNFLRTLKK